MAILDAATLAAMAAAANDVINDNPATISLRRDGGTDPAAQTVRIEYSSRVGEIRQAANSEETVADVIIVGPVALDIQKEDRFNYGGSLYRVTLVRPNRQVMTQAEAQIIQ